MSITEVTTQQAAELLNCSPRTIRNMIARGTLRARMVKIDPTVEKGVYLIPYKQIDDILKKNSPQKARVSNSS